MLRGDGGRVMTEPPSRPEARRRLGSPYPNSCLGTSPHQQEGDTKMQSVCGIDVSKDRLDIMVLPEQQYFSVRNDAAGWAELVERLRGLSISAIGSGDRTADGVARRAPSAQCRESRRRECLQIAGRSNAAAAFSPSHQKARSRYRHA